jgi:hypothetical protein
MAAVSERRVSDREREAALRQLSEHVAVGRLTMDELPARVEDVQGARTRSDLDRALSDLPDLGTLRARLARVPLRVHVGAFIVVNAALVLLWQITRAKPMGPEDSGAGYWWPFWIIGIWAVLLIAWGLRSRRPRRGGWALPRG